jgi:hypothetical protein
MKLKAAFKIDWDRTGGKPLGRRGFTPHRWAWGFVNLDRYNRMGKSHEALNPVLIWTPRQRRIVL